jgi:hypothetical protein
MHAMQSYSMGSVHRGDIKLKTVKNWRKMPQKRVAEQLGNAPRILSTQGSIVKCHEKCTLFVVGPFGPMCALQPRGVNNIL